VTDVDNPDRRESDSPAYNYTVPQNQPAGMRIPEFVLRQLISWALKQVRLSLDNPRNIVDELYAMAGPDLIKQIKEWLRAHENIFIDVSWPRDDQNLPLIVVEPQGEQEETEMAFLGDLAGTMDYGRFDNGIPTMRPQFAIPERHTTNIYIASQDDRLTLFLYTLVKYIIISNKDQLTQWYDIHNLVVGGQVIEHDPNLFPTFGYYRVLTLSYMCLFDFNGSEEAAKIVSLDLMVTTQQQDINGVETEVISPVPAVDP
jgi:hypothetical protein